MSYLSQSAIRPSPSTAATLDQATIEACAGIAFGGAADIAAWFPGGFIGWFNATLAASAAFRHRGRIDAGPIVGQRFDRFWDQIPVIFGTSRITAVEFAALVSIAIQETAGNLWANPELVGAAGHPGLAYAFDRIPGLKASYNRTNGNVSAFQLFQDADYLDAHGPLAGAETVRNGGVSRDWDGETWPAGMPTTPDAAVNGFVMQADFYKFRGRGIIQTTGRDGYKRIIGFVLDDPVAMANPALATLAQRWKTAASGRTGDALLDAIGTRSTNADWDAAFGEAAVLAAAVRIDSDGKGRYLALSHAAPVLNSESATPGSLYAMARKINAGNYPNIVVPMMQTMIGAIAVMVSCHPQR